MRVKMRTHASGPGINWAPGSIQDVTEQHGEQLIRGGYAEPVTPAAIPALETATTQPPETRAEAAPTAAKASYQAVSGEKRRMGKA